VKGIRKWREQDKDSGRGDEGDGGEREIEG